MSRPAMVRKPLAGESEDVPKARILQAARTRFESFGFRRTTIAEIARDAGIAVGTVYRYFENKEEILVAAVNEASEAWLVDARAILAGPGTAEERFSRLGKSSIEYFRKDVLLRSVLDRDAEIILAPLIDRIYQRLVQQLVAVMAQAVRDGIRERSFRKIDPEQAAFILLIAGRALMNQKTHPYDQIQSVFGDMVLNGLRAR
jgi:AcrR family transcriptional regulator